MSDTEFMVTDASEESSQQAQVVPDKEEIVQELIDEDGDLVEETTQITRKTVKRSMKITEVSDFLFLSIYFQVEKVHIYFWIASNG